MKISIKDLRDKVPDIIFKQGMDYFKDDRVKIKQIDNKLHALEKRKRTESKYGLELPLPEGRGFTG